VFTSIIYKHINIKVFGNLSGAINICSRECSLLSYVGMSIITIDTATNFSAVASDFVFVSLIEAIIMNLR